MSSRSFQDRDPVERVIEHPQGPVKWAFFVHEDAHVRVGVVQPPSSDPESRLQP
jgi:hypothetical protein